VYVALNIADGIRNALSLPPPKAKFILYEGVPGCGKTRSLIASYKEGDLVVASAKEVAESIRAALIKSGVLSKNQGSVRVRTIDSYIIRPSCIANTVFADEALMAHAGALATVARLSKAKEVRLYGDRHQIPFINFHPLYKLVYSAWDWFDKVITNSVTYRCPVDVAAGLFDIYNGKIFSASSIIVSMSLKRISTINQVPKEKDVHYLTFLRADKAELKRLKYGKVSTVEEYNLNSVHEAQGETYKKVALVRLQAATSEIYESSPHCVVAVSRHTHQFVYYTTGGNDLVTRILENSTDPVRRQKATYRKEF